MKSLSNLFKVAALLAVPYASYGYYYYARTVDVSTTATPQELMAAVSGIVKASKKHGMDLGVVLPMSGPMNKVQFWAQGDDIDKMIQVGRKVQGDPEYAKALELASRVMSNPVDTWAQSVDMG